MLRMNPPHIYRVKVLIKTPNICAKTSDSQCSIYSKKKKHIGIINKIMNFNFLRSMIHNSGEKLNNLKFAVAVQVGY